MRELANNIKHFYATEDGQIQETSSEQKTWEEIDCTWENWQVPWRYDGLILITKENHWISALNVFQKVHDYWIGHFNTFFQKIKYLVIPMVIPKRKNLEFREGLISKIPY